MSIFSDYCVFSPNMTTSFFQSKNPYTREILNAFPAHNDLDILRIIETTQKNQRSFAQISVSQRVNNFRQVENLLLSGIEGYSRLISQEMGKPIRQSRAEIEKCAWLCRYYADHLELFLKEEVIRTEAVLSSVRHDPMGIVLAIMPWNFPFWQVFRCAIPALSGGNAVILKHASNVFGCALAMEQIFSQSGFHGVFRSLIIGSDKVSQVIQNQNIRAVSFTGSELAGRKVASLAGSYLKKVVLELGGSNSFIADETVEMEEVISQAVVSRFQNNGQSCIASKRFLIHVNRIDEFTQRFEEAVSALVLGNPLLETTDLGPLAKPEFNDELFLQLETSVNMGAQLLCGGSLSEDGIFLPTLLTGVHSSMPVFQEETFGPLAAISSFSTIEEAIQLHESTRFGLGVNIFTNKVQEWLPHVSQISDGAVFFNSMVKSDPRLPFGGSKDSGYGRELSRDGMMEFINRKTLYIA